MTRTMTDAAPEELSPSFARMYAVGGRRSRRRSFCARCQILYTVRSERKLIEQLDYNLTFRWFVRIREF